MWHNLLHFLLLISSLHLHKQVYGLAQSGMRCCCELCRETGLSCIKALVLLFLFYPSSSASPPFQLFGSLPGNPNSPTCESRRKARAKYRRCCVSLSFPPMPATLLPPSGDPQLYVHIFPLWSVTSTTTPDLVQAWGLWLYTPCSCLAGLEGNMVTFTHRSAPNTLSIYANTFVSPSFISGNYKKR